jgi:hypothetical protein
LYQNSFFSFDAQIDPNVQGLFFMIEELWTLGLHHHHHLVQPENGKLEVL